MNWSSIIWSVLKVFLYWAIVVAVYRFAIASVEVRRKNATAPALTSEKIFTYLSCVGACLLVSALLAFGLGTNQEGGDSYNDPGETVVDFEPTTQEQVTYGTKVFLVLLPISLIGTYAAFEKDKTLTIEERYKIKRQIGSDRD